MCAACCRGMIWQSHRFANGARQPDQPTELIGRRKAAACSKQAHRFIAEGPPTVRLAPDRHHRRFESRR
jgi:hypothetical protein